ncbi:myb/SANT-like DNA-binding domain-containing protein 3 [Aphis craccivora]|uniref:Myb/SANT-like DNA-binding domain-containing protein 3 n=1 Tax=Aphis craccivora TaxID=307492 RepID=A0A6G0YLG2_APHCR|nr:myb/SANT-like DNA-binding domain-containing protein 3 [Aphis craccivora]
MHIKRKGRNRMQKKKQTNLATGIKKTQLGKELLLISNTHLGANSIGDSKCTHRFWEVEKAKCRKEFAREREEHMETEGGPEKKKF